ncbi:hypothetical protein BG011_007913 [Mortierella polycephala]|uniref:SRR1-like domain-containing protein n=1 Tax=Mortierella polycephala TaxID=41804 RepID=A0A9P6PPX6_9FUNG|nr:hypothetical protein BG011_007913 [Mortierella polycephala]
MSTCKESESGLQSTLQVQNPSTTTTFNDAIDDDIPFTFVSRKRHGRKTVVPLAISETKVQSAKAAWATANEGNVNLPGWTTRKPTRVKKNSQRAKMMGSQNTDQEERTLQWGLNIVEERTMTLKQSRFYGAFQDLVQLTLFPTCKSLRLHKSTALSELVSGTSDLSEMKDDLKSKKGTPSLDMRTKDSESQGSSPPFIDMVCYGIGSIESSRASQFQLALALCLKDMLQVSGSISIYDPAMTEYDRKLVTELGMDALTTNDQTKQPIETRTLLYMPHCPKGLYSHVLETNWTGKRLDQLVILGNRFSMYDESPSFRQIAKQAPFIFPALSIAQVTLFPKTKFEDDTVFNDLAFHVFSPTSDVLPIVDLHDREEDPELL